MSCAKILFLFEIVWSPEPDLNQHARNERGILSSLDRDITPDKPYCFNSFTVFIWVLKGYRGLFVAAECQQPGGYRTCPIGAIT